MDLRHAGVACGVASLDPSDGVARAESASLGSKQAEPTWLIDQRSMKRSWTHRNMRAMGYLLGAPVLMPNLVRNKL